MSDLMYAQDVSYRQLASGGVSNAGYLNKIARGIVPAPGPAIAEALDKKLDAGGALAALARREHAPPAPTGPKPLGDDDAAKARATTQHLVALDTLEGSDGLSTLAVRSFRRVADQLAVVGGNSDVRSAVADLGAAAAWITSDDVQRDQSRAIALEALAQADLAGDKRLHRFLLSHLSMVSEHAGRYGDALAYAERLAQEDIDNPRMQAVIGIRRARALSGLGAYTDAIAAWDHAEHLLTESPSSDDGLTYWIHDSEMAIHKAVILTRAGSRDAVDWAHRGIEWLPGGQGRDQVLFRAMLLHDAVAAHAWKEVPTIVQDLLRYAGDTRSARVPEEIRIASRLANIERAPKQTKEAIRAAVEAFPASAP